MKKMPNKTPQFWADILSWFNSNAEVISAAALSFVISTLMRLKDGETKRSAILDGTICGFLSLCIVSALEYFGISSKMVTFFGGFIGFIGVSKLSEIVDSVLSIIGSKFGISNKQ